MTLGRCSTCKHFKPADEPYYGMADDKAPDPFDDVALRDRAKTDALLPGDRPTLRAFFDGFCLLAEMPTEDEEIRERAPKMLASSIDGSGYRGSLLVRLDFGCVQWEAKV